VTSIESLLDINTQQWSAGGELKLNGIARISLNVQQALAADAYDVMRTTGSFILIDEVSHQTVAAGMIRIES
jgi:sulfate adenylyltransferase subunit 1